MDTRAGAADGARGSAPDTAPDTVSDTAPDSVSDTAPDSVADSVADTAPDTVAGAVPDDTASRPLRDREATTRRILEAATRLFAEHGYDQVTMRMIANAADANVALVNRYFGSKANLFAEVIAARSPLERVVEGDPAGLPARLGAYVARRIAAETSDPVARAIDRAGSSPEIKAVLRRRVEVAMIAPIAAKLAGPGARERAAIAAAIILGGGSLRRTLGQDAARDVDPASLERRLTAVFTEVLAP